MKRSIRSWTVLWVVLFGATAVNAQEAAKIAFLDAQRVLDETQAGKTAKKTMEEYRDSRQKIIDMEESEIKTLQDDLGRQQAVLDDTARKEREERLQRKLMGYQQRVTEFSRELDNKKRDVLLDFNKGLIAAVEKIAAKKGYAFVFDRNAEGGVLLFAQGSFDITNEVIKEYDAATP